MTAAELANALERVAAEERSVAWTQATVLAVGTLAMAVVVMWALDAQVREQTEPARPSAEDLHWLWASG